MPKPDSLNMKLSQNETDKSQMKLTVIKVN